MKKLLLAVVLMAMVGFTNSMNAAGKMSLSIGPDVLLPMGDFGDVVSTGFGGSVRGQYDIDPMFSVGLTVGYYVWSGEDVAGISLPDAKGVPIRVFGKYYFMPEGSARVYGIAELGLFIASAQEVTIGGVTYTGESSTDFNYAPGIGVELPLGGGNTKIDISARYDAIATSGSTSGSFAGRVGINFGLGN